jgi:uncharacterized repeat protein (TIGR01451 family)
LNKKIKAPRMFRKLIANLPFNPSLLGQVTFYARRLRREESIRRLGFGITAMGILVQTLAVLAPPQTSLATSANDIVYGATTKKSITTALANNQDNLGRQDIQAIYNYYGITLDDVNQATSTTVLSRERNYTTTGRSDSPGVDVKVPILGAVTDVYERSLNVWDIINYENSYPAITGVASGEGLLKGKRFWILLKGCGNITFEELPRNPNLEVIKVRTTPSVVKPGDEVAYDIQFRNTGAAAAESVVIKDSLPAEFDFLGSFSAYPHIPVPNGNQLQWNLAMSLEPSQNWHTITIRVRARPIVETSKQVCNIAEIVAKNSSNVTSSNNEGERCVRIDYTCPGTDQPVPNGDLSQCPDNTPEPEPEPTPTPTPEPTPEPTPQPAVYCDLFAIKSVPAWNKRTFQVKFGAENGGKVTSVEYFVNGVTVKTSSVDGLSNEYTHTFSGKGNFDAHVRIAGQVGSIKTGGNCKVTGSIIQPEARAELTKKVRNVTQSIADANNTVAKPGDVLEYTLVVKNSGTGDLENYAFNSDSLADILEYATIKDPGGGTFDKDTLRILWPASTIGAGSSLERTFSVQVKNPLPTTAPSASDPLSYDFRLRNVFGNEVVVKLDTPVLNQVVTSAKELPNTGPGASLVISFAIFALFGYFFYRSRLLRQEVEIVRAEYGAGGWV